MATGAAGPNKKGKSIVKEKNKKVKNNLWEEFTYEEREQYRTVQEADLRHDSGADGRKIPPADLLHYRQRI
jgi:hypothetical protein